MCRSGMSTWRCSKSNELSHARDGSWWERGLFQLRFQLVNSFAALTDKSLCLLFLFPGFSKEIDILQMQIIFLTILLSHKMT